MNEKNVEKKAPPTYEQIHDGTDEENKLRDRLINEQILNGFVESYSMSLLYKNKYYPVHLHQDIVQTIYTQILELRTSKILTTYYQGKSEHARVNRVRAFLSGVIHRQIISTSSLVYTTYKKFFDKHKMVESVLCGSDDLLDKLNEFKTDEEYERYVQNLDNEIKQR